MLNIELYGLDKQILTKSWLKFYQALCLWGWIVRATTLYGNPTPTLYLLPLLKISKKSFCVFYINVY